MKSDLVIYTDLLKSRGVRWAVVDEATGVEIAVEQGCGIRWSGYLGFGFSFHFDHEGTLIAVGASEG